MSESIMTDHVAMTELDREQRKRKTHGLGLALLLLTIVVVGAGYLGYTHGWTATKRSIGGFAQSTMRILGETSQDAAMAAKIKAALALSKSVSAFDVHVRAREGYITLTGQVPSEEVKHVAEVIVRDTSGVTAVNNYLAVDPRAKADELRKELGLRVADLEVKTLISDFLNSVPALKAAPIVVRVEEGTVSLSGSVDSEELRDNVKRFVSSLEGVHGLVLDDLKVGAAEPTTENPAQALSRHVEFNLYSTKAFNLSLIQIHGSNGIVTLEGSVRSQAERLLAEKIALETEGVHKVMNELRVLPESMVS